MKPEDYKLINQAFKEFEAMVVPEHFKKSVDKTVMDFMFITFVSGMCSTYSIILESEVNKESEVDKYGKLRKDLEIELNLFRIEQMLKCSQELKKINL